MSILQDKGLGERISSNRDAQEIEKTAFKIEHGHYEILSMLFGFQRVTDNVLRGLHNEHMQNLGNVFQR